MPRYQSTGRDGFFLGKRVRPFWLKLSKGLRRLRLERFLAALPGERICYGHIAGHYNEAEDLIVDTHGAAVIDPVWYLLDKAYELLGVFPTLLERDFNIPPLPELLGEVGQVRALQARATAARGEQALA